MAHTPTSDVTDFLTKKKDQVPDRLVWSFVTVAQHVLGYGWVYGSRDECL